MPCRPYALAAGHVTLPSLLMAFNRVFPDAVMTMASGTRSNPHSDGEKANTPDKHRNDDATWKDHDQPDIPHEDKEPRDPDRDYPDARDTVPR